MKYLNFILMTMLILLISLPQASAFLDIKLFDDRVDNYGKITIRDYLGLSNKAEYTLNRVGSSVINVWAEGNYTLYQSTELFSGVDFENTLGELQDLRDIKFFILVNESYVVETPVYNDNCVEDPQSPNRSVKCTPTLARTDSQTYYKTSWEPYAIGDPLTARSGKWRLEAKRLPNQRIDFVLNAHGKRFTEWAWWNTSWSNKRNITGFTANLSIITVNTSYSATWMDDYRFINGAETEELGYWLESNTSTTAIYRINTTDESTIYLYYGNPSVSTLSNITDVYDAIQNFYTFEEGSGTKAIDRVNGVCNLTTWVGAQYNGTAKIGDYSAQIIANNATTKIQGDTCHNIDALTEFSWGGFSYPTKNNGVFVTKGEDASFGYRSIQNSGSGNWENVGDGSAIKTSGATNVDLSKWQLFIATAKVGGNLVTYRDGVAGTGTAISAFGNPNTFLRLGNCYAASCASANDQYKGNFDEFMFFSKELTAQDILDINNTQVDGVAFGAEETINSLTVTLVTPADNLKTQDPDINFICTSTDETGVLNLTLIIDGSDNETLTGGIGQNLTLNTNKNLSEGAHTWTCRASDGTGTADPVTASTRSIVVDQTIPTVNITYPSENQNFLTLSVPYTIVFNLTASDSGAGLDTCVFWNGTGNTTVTCNANYSQNLNGGYHTVILYANDSAGNSNTVTRNFLIQAISSSIGFDPSELEGDPTIIYLNISAVNITTITANLTYNNTVYPVNLSHNGTFAVINSTVLAPNVNSVSNVTLWYNYSINSASLNTSYYNQTIYPIPDLVVQNTTCTTAALYFNLKDEQNFTILNGTFDYNFLYGSAYNNTFSKKYGSVTGTEFFVCVNTTISQNWSVGSGEIFYSSPGYVDRRYYLFTGRVLNATLDNITLYELAASEQTSFKLEVEDTSLNSYIENYTALLRWYPQLDDYLIVEMGQTDIDGSTVIHVQAEDVDYRIAAYNKDGSLVKIDPSTRMLCLVNPCTYTMRISPVDTDFTSVFDVSYSFTYNQTTGIWRFIYSDATQHTSLMNLTIYKVTGTAVYPICNDFSTSYTGVLTCNTSAFSGTLRGEVKRSASPSTPFIQKVIQTTTNSFTSTWGLWLSLILAIPITFTFALVSPIAALIGGIVSLIPALYLGSINWAIFGGIMILGGIVAHFLKRIG